MKGFADRLMSAVQTKGNPCVVGIDFHATAAPEYVRAQLSRYKDPESVLQSLGQFFRDIIDVVAPIVPAIKPQSALLEQFTWVGARLLAEIISYGQSQNLVVILDAKRSDIASSAMGYANALLGTDDDGFRSGYDADAATVNPFLGRDSLEPFLEVCRKRGKGVFVLVKNSNPGSAETQNVLLHDGTPVYSLYARMVAELGAACIGRCGYSDVGAVVGATCPREMVSIRKLLPRAILLVPGYGSQGASAHDVACAFNADGFGAIVNASRSITAKLSSPRVTREEFKECVRQNALQMVDEITLALKRGS